MLTGQRIRHFVCPNKTLHLIWVLFNYIIPFLLMQSNLKAKQTLVAIFKREHFNVCACETFK